MTHTLMITNLFEFKKQLDNHGIFFSFCGPISQNMIVDIGKSLKKKLQLEEAGAATIFKIFSMFIEHSQNIIHYSAEKLIEEQITNENAPGKELRFGIIAIGYENNIYFVSAGNLIKNNAVEHFRQKLLKLQKMTKDEMNQYYKELRKHLPEEGSKGAGLGLVEIARKSSLPIEFNFNKIDDDSSFFSIKSTI